MTSEVKDWMKGLVEQIAKAPSACPTLKSKAEDWLAKCDTEALGDETKKFLEELKLDVCTPAQTRAFFETEKARELFGKDRAAELKKHAEELIAKGEAYCDCPACAPGSVLLLHEEFLLK